MNSTFPNSYRRHYLFKLITKMTTTTNTGEGGEGSGAGGGVEEVDSGDGGDGKLKEEQDVYIEMDHEEDDRHGRYSAFLHNV